MKYVRIKLYQNGKFTTFEECYIGDSQVKALEQFRKSHPNTDRPDCTCTAETIDSDDPKWKEYFEVARRCGAVR